MSNKPYSKLNELDKLLRQHFPANPDRMGDQLVIRKVCGFELFNTRPYHNYETWSDGYIIENNDISVNAEDLDDAVKNFITADGLYKLGYVNEHGWVYLPENHNRVIAKVKNNEG